MRAVKEAAMRIAGESWDNKFGVPVDSILAANRRGYVERNWRFHENDAISDLLAQGTAK